MEKRKIHLLILGSVVAPFLFHSIILLLMNRFKISNDIAVISSMSISAILPALFIYKLPIEKTGKIVLTIAYALVLAYLLLLFSLGFVCVVFGDCL
jgi:hypothetical protein